MHKSWFFRLFDYLSGLIVAIAVSIASFARAVLRIDYGYAWQAARDVSLAAYRDIVGLHPVYRESYETHGLSLPRRRAGC